MPSGAKKRKAAQKKKEKEAKQISLNPHPPLSNDDQRSHDKSESDDGVSSRSSSDHEKNEESTREFTKKVSENTESFGKSGFEDEGSITIQHESKTDKNVESADSASSSSSSDDESHEIEKENNQDLAAEPIQHLDFDEPNISLQENVGEVAVNAPLPDATTGDLILETVPVNDSSKRLVSETEEQTSLEALTENRSEVPDDVKPVLSENIQKLPDAAPGGSSGTVVKDLSISGEKSEASSAVTGIVVKDDVDDTLTLSNPAGELTNTSENVQEPRVSESAKEKPSPLVAQRTSWLSCCGLLDVVTGSGRQLQEYHVEK